jgi:hypothetical protein
MRGSLAEKLFKVGSKCCALEWVVAVVLVLLQPNNPAVTLQISRQQQLKKRMFCIVTFLY